MPDTEADACYKKVTSLSPTQKGWCSRPFPVEVLAGREVVILVTTRNAPGTSPQLRNTSRLDLYCK